MPHLHLHTSRPDVWRDVARRLRHSSIASAGPSKTTIDVRAQAEVFDGAEQAQPEALERALAAGHHVLIAAEPCLTRSAIASLTAQAQTKHLQIAFWNPDRFLPSRQLIRKQIGGPLGQAELVRSHRWDPAGAAPAGLPGPLLGEIEQALWLIDQAVQSVFAIASPASDAHPGRHYQVHLAANPGMALIDYDNRLPAGAGYRALSVIGSSGSAQADDQDNVQLAFGGGNSQALTAGEGIRHLATMLDDFGKAIESRADLSASTNLCLRTVLVADAVKNSLQSGQASRVEER